MSRFLFVVPPLLERARPTVCVARELSMRGHEVAWTGPHELVGPMALVGADRRSKLHGWGTTAAWPVGGLRSPAGLMLLWDDFLLPLAHEMLPEVRSAVEEFEPDALVVDQQALAGAAVGHLYGLPWATIVPSSAGLADPFSDLPEIARRVRHHIHTFMLDAGLDDVAAASMDPQSSPHLVIVFSTEALTGPVGAPSGRHAFVGPFLTTPDDVPFNWGWLDPDRPLVLVSQEVPPRRHGARLYQVAAEALASRDVQAVVVAPPDLVPGPSANVTVVPRAPLRPLARRAAAVVCDGGHGTVCEALVNGVPLVVAPMIGEQPLVAEQVVRAGCALRVAGKVDARQLGWAVDAVLTDAEVQAVARRVRDSFASAGGSFAAADRLEALVHVASSPWAPLLRRDRA